MFSRKVELTVFLKYLQFREQREILIGFQMLVRELEQLLQISAMNVKGLVSLATD